MTSQIINEKINQACEKDHYVLYFKCNNTYDVIQKEKCVKYNLVENRVKVFYPKNKNYFEGKIIYEGTKTKCDKKCKKYIKNETTEISSTDNDGMHLTQMNNQSNDSKSRFTREFEKLETTRNIKRQRSPSPALYCINESLINENSQNTVCLCQNEYKKLKIEIENLRMEINDNLINHFNSIKELILTIPKKQATDEQYPMELWYNQINLLDFGAPNIQKYISKLMDELYSEQEMGESFVIDGASTSKKKPLDLEKLHKIRDAVYIKYRVPNGKKNEYWEIVKDKACRKCLDVAKKIRKN